MDVSGDSDAAARLRPFAPQDERPTVAEAAVTRRLSYRVVKRGLDVFVSLVGLLVLSPLFAVIAVLVHITSAGPVLYDWDVVGRGGHPFRGYKFRSMVVDADERRGGLLQLNEMRGPVFKIGQDPRVTPLGRVLRKYSLDELPQLWSVLIGDMSLVGPRPAFQREWLAYAPWQRARLGVTPGITCLWQIRGRNRIRDFDEWARLDLQYVERWSLLLDAQILARTLPMVLRGTGR